MISPPAPSPAFLDDFFEALAPRVSGDLRRDDMTCALYATDASMYQVMPYGVLFPKRPADVQAALETAHRFEVPVLPRGGGSSLAGQTVNAALVIDFSRYLDAILEVNPEERWARVEPGLVLDHLNTTLEEHGLTVGPDPASSNRATLGGMLANNATGTHSIRYGNMIHHVRRVKGYLSDGTPFDFGPLDEDGWAEKGEQKGREGEVFRALARLIAEEEDIIRRDTPKHWRRNSGYRLEYLLPGEVPGAVPPVGRFTDGAAMNVRNPAQLLCGSEGTLAVVTEITLSLVERPPQTALGIAHFETRDEALRAVTTILETDPSAVELFDGVAIESARSAPGFSHRLTFIDGDPGAVLITEYEGRSVRKLAEKLDALERTLAEAGTGYSVVRILAPEQIRNVWSVRKEGLGLIMGVRGAYKPVAFIEDASVPVEHLADYIDELSTLIEEAEETRAVYYAHASAGTLHVRPFIDTKRPEEVEKMKRIAEGSMELVARYGGSVSSEHGDGRARGWLNERLLGSELCDVYRRVKKIFDPKGLLNPGIILDTPPMDRDLRMGPDYETIPVLTEMDFSENDGFQSAVELCNGNGACRKLQSGTMCPSFMVTREEEDSTRGRANALRNAMSGALPPEELTSERMFEVMDLCIQCKACKTECPSNVDMAKIKTEWLDKYWQEHRMPFRTRLFAHLPKLSRRLAGGVLARTANWANEKGPVRALLNRTLGISRERALPPFAEETFSQWFEQHARRTDGPPVVLFADTFNDCHSPVVARAAAEFLERIGMAVEVPETKVCCGRTLLSKGLVSDAQIRALEAVDALYPYAEEDHPVVGLEPSCVSALTDDLLDLIPGDPRAEKVAESVYSFEAFVAHLADAGFLDDVAWNDQPRDVLLHGHCHQKALEGIEATERILSFPPGYRVEALDAGCCGMAGAFGYEKEHLDISKQMAERRLAPAVRQAGEDTLIAAPGFSCRSQIKDVAGRKALHPAQILRDALA